ncbi:hypothetical protein OH77DRAFT_545994 [Trametes cingulata]|nr:hypothetical protein OH77DRAFT_545994 [Trametes cingulata]
MTRSLAQARSSSGCSCHCDAKEEWTGGRVSERVVVRRYARAATLTHPCTHHLPVAALASSTGLFPCSQQKSDVRPRKRPRFTYLSDVVHGRVVHFQEQLASRCNRSIHPAAAVHAYLLRASDSSVSGHPYVLRTESSGVLPTGDTWPHPALAATRRS